MKAAYIGILTPGSTSRMRAERLRELTNDWDWEWIDTDPPLEESARIWRTLAFRVHAGPGVDRMNELVSSRTSGKEYDLLWVDKAVYLTPATMTGIRSRTRKLVHFTPDTAFHANRSRHFEQNLNLFDLLVTTKSFEVDEYKSRLTKDTLHVTTQGFDPNVHFPRATDAERRREAIFIGLAEPSRERVVDALLRANVPVRLAGRGWSNSVRRFSRHPHFFFEGEDVFGDDYASLLSRSWVGLGLLSKRFPELHTTRTFEIPACGALLATELNPETAKFYSTDEALFFNSIETLVKYVCALFAQNSFESMRAIARRGRERTLSDCRDYPSILAAVLRDPRISPDPAPP